MSDAASVRAERSWQDHKVPHALYTDESIYHQELDRIFTAHLGTRGIGRDITSTVVVNLIRPRCCSQIPDLRQV